MVKCWRKLLPEPQCPYPPGAEASRDRDPRRRPPPWGGWDGGGVLCHFKSWACSAWGSRVLQDPGPRLSPGPSSPAGPETTGPGGLWEESHERPPRPLCRGDSWELTVGGAQPLTPLGFSRSQGGPSLRVRAHGPYNNMRNLKNKLGP